MTTINVKGPIISNSEKWIYEWFGKDATCPNDVINALPADGSDVTVIISSGGGYVNSGNEIYTTLKSYQGHVTVDVIDAASAASVIAMAGDTIRISPVGQIMIHNVACGAGGDYHVMDKTSEVLQKSNQSISAAYQLKTGLSREALLELMDAETWMTAEEALEKGFVDEIMFQDESSLKLVASNANLLPDEIVLRMQNFKKSGKFNKMGSMKNEFEDSFDKVIEKAIEKAINKIDKKAEPVKEPENSISRFLF